MNKTTEALKLAEEALLTPLETTKFIQRASKALAAIREALANHSGDGNEMVAEPVCRSDGRCQYAIDHGAEGLGHCPTGKCCMPSEPVKQEPVAHYKDAPHTIYLQTGCEDPEFCECSFNEWGDTTWCKDQIHDTDIPYIRADYAAPVSAPKQEPVAWAYIDADGSFMDALDRQHGAYQTPLYAASVSVEAAVLAEREACAKVAESVVTKQSKHINDGKPFYDHMYWEDIAAAIRARGEK